MREKSLRAVLAVMLALVAAPPVASQEPDRRGIERELEEAEREVRELRKKLRQTSRDEERYLVRPSRFISNRARLGLVVQGAPRPATDSTGAWVQAVSPGGPADGAGLRAGDIVVAVNGEPLGGRAPGQRLVELVGELETGDTASVDYSRDGARSTARIVARILGARDFAFAFSDSLEFEVRGMREPLENALESIRELDVRISMPRGWMDMELVSMNDQLGEYFGTTDGLLVIRAPRDGALNLRSGDVILSIDGRAPYSPSQAVRILRSYEPGESVELHILRHKKKTTVTGSVPERDRGLWTEKRY